VRYNAVVVPVVRRYALSQKLDQVLIEGDSLQRPISPRDDEQPLKDFVSSVEHLSDDQFAGLLGSRHRTSSRGGILKSSAVRQIAQILVDEGIQTLEDVSMLLKDVKRTSAVETRLNKVRGSGTQGIRTGYLWMLAGDDLQVKPDRHVLKWMGHVLGRRISVVEARSLLMVVATLLDITPWSIDHAIWKKMSRRG
jgi:hypothetical protein